MSNVREKLKYTKSHEWIELHDDGTAVIGISDHAQELLGDLVYIEVPEVGSAISQGDACAVVESVKAASDVYAPLSGEVIESNEALADTPEVVNQSAFDDGWLFKMKITDESELEDLLSADDYKQELEEE